MSFPQNSHYLESKVLTAPPHRLHLMLIEGAIRYGRQAEDALRQGDQTAAAAPLMRVLDIVGELLAGVREKKSALNHQIGDFYWYLFRHASLAKVSGDVAKLREVIGLLEFERQTWQLVCDKLGNETTPVPRAPIANLRQPHAMKSGLSLEA